MSNVNNWEFSNHLQNFQTKILEPQRKKIVDAEVIMHNPAHPWKDEAQKQAAGKQLEVYKAWLLVYQTHYDAGMRLVQQHEAMVNQLSKWYNVWRENISNEGRQEVEMMGSQADMLQQVFEEMYKELLPLKLEIKAPAPLNLK